MKKVLKLNVVINILVILVVFFATVIHLYSSMDALKTSLTNNYLESNHNYATKLAEEVDYITDELQKELSLLLIFLVPLILDNKVIWTYFSIQRKDTLIQFFCRYQWSDSINKSKCY